MNLQKNECPQQNIKFLRLISIRQKILKTEAGQISWAMGLLFALFLAVFLCAALQLERYRMVSMYMEDALAASNLASAVVDLEEYGISHKIKIADPYAAYELYKQALKGNLNLNDAWAGQAGGVIQGEVRIVNYTVYNVSGDKVMVYSFDENGAMTEWQDYLGAAASPDGIPIETTSVYSEIALTVKSFPGVEVEAHKGKLADVIR